MDVMRCPVELTRTAEEFVRQGEMSCGEDTFAIEEAAEYIQSMCKLKRYIHEFAAGTTKSYMVDYAKQQLAQEMAHVYLTLNHMRVLYDIPLELIQAGMDIKIAKYGLPIYRKDEEDA